MNQSKAIRNLLKALEPFEVDAKYIHDGWSNERRRSSLQEPNPITIGDCRRVLLAANAFRDTLEQNEEPVVNRTQISEEAIAVLLTETFSDDTLQSDDLALIRAVERYHGITKETE